MIGWWDRWPEVYDAEMGAFDRRGITVARDAEAFDLGHLRLTCTFEIQEIEVAVMVQYPDGYPFLPPQFLAVSGLEHLTRHVSPAGVICLLGRDHRNWNRGEAAADLLVEQLNTLLSLDAAGPHAMRQAEDPQGEPYTEWYSYVRTGAILLSDEIRAAAADCAGGEFTVCFSPGPWFVDGGGSIGQGVVTRISEGPGGPFVEAGRLVGRGRDFAGHWVRLDAPPDATLSPSEVGGLIREAMGRSQPHFQSFGDWEIAIEGVVFPEEVRQGQEEDGWLFVVTLREERRTARTNSKAKRGSRRKKPFEGTSLVRGIRAGVRDLAQRIPELAGLQDKRVLVVGLGALGASVARELARGMVGDLVVVDYDFSDAGPTVRWEYGMGVVGPNKALAVAAELARDYPYSNVEPHDFKVGSDDGKGSPGSASLDELIMHADLVVDATADGNVTALLALKTTELRTPLIAVWGIEGYGGVVVRCRPDVSCYFCLELHSACEDGSLPLPRGPVGDARLQPAGCASPTFAASAMDLRDLTNQAVRMAFHELTESDEGGYPAYRHDVYVLWHRNPDGSLVDPPCWVGHEAAVHPECPCH